MMSDAILHMNLNKLVASRAPNAGPHEKAWTYPRDGFERALQGFIMALGDYADAHRARYGTPIAQDYVLGEYWRDIARSVLGLLDGESGRFDCGTLDSSVRDLGKEAGFEADANWDVKG